MAQTKELKLHELDAAWIIVLHGPGRGVESGGAVRMWHHSVPPGHDGCVSSPVGNPRWR